MDTAPDGRGAPLPSERDPVQTLVSRSIDACDTDIQHNLWSNVILSGGCTLTHSYVERLQIELNLTAVVFFMMPT
jgi:actin-related protein